MAERRISTFFIFFLFFSVFAPLLEARELPLPEEEAPTALFEAELRDSEVDFFIQGGWRAELSGGFGLAWGSAVEGVQPAVLPDFTEGYYFKQTPALDLSLWYRNRYFFETSLTEEQTLETFLFGYYGEEDELLRELRFGNTDIGYGEIGPFSVPAASRNSLGAYTRLNTESSEHRIALRYDPARTEELHFRGQNLIEEETIPVDRYIQGRFFVLPDEDVSDLELFLQDDAGLFSDTEGRRYRRLDSSEVSISAAEGLVYLKVPAAADLAVHYTAGGFTVGDSDLGIDALCGVSGTGDSARLDLSASAPKVDFNFEVTDTGYLELGLNFSTLERSIDGKTCLLLYSPGQWSPFELQGAYSAASLPGGIASGISGGGADLYLSPRGGSGGILLPTAELEDGQAFRIAPEGATLRDHEARYPLLPEALPLADAFPDAKELYGPHAPGAAVEMDRELRLEKLSPVTGYNLGPNALEGSIEVLRNGVPTKNYSFDPDTGELVFFLPPAAGERIDIRYRSSSARAIGGDLFAAASNTFRLGESWSADLSLGIRWNADPNAYTTETGQAEGSALAVGGLEYHLENISFRVEGGLNLSSPNTTGRLRLFGMEDSAYPVVPGPENLYPGAPLTSAEYEGDPAAALDLSHATRGRLYFRDYYAYSFAGGFTLQHYDTALPAEKIYPYDEAGGENRTGPYPASTGAETDGDAMVLEYELDHSQWVSGRIPLADGNGTIDLSSARALSLLVKHTGRPGEEASGTVYLHIVVGRLAEDLDDDGTLDEENSPYDGGFLFDPASGPSLPVAPALVWAPQTSRINTEDLDGNEVLDGSTGALPEPVVNSEQTLGGSSPTIKSGDWYRLIIPLSSSDREKLTASTALDIVLAESSASSAAGRLLVADIDFEGSPFSGQPTPSSTLDIHTRSLDLGPESSDYSLLSMDEARLLNGDSLFDTRVLRIAWDITSGTGDTWEAEGFLPPTDIGDYGALSFFMKTGTAPPDSLTLRLQNPDREGLAVKFSPRSHTEWRRYTWNLDVEADQGRITVDGEPLSASDVSIAEVLNRQRSASGVNRLVLTGTTSSAGTGEIEIDEIFLHNPVLGFGAGGKTEFSFRRPGTVLSFAGRPLIEDLSFRQEVYGRQDGYGGGLSAAPAENFAHQSDLGFSSFGTRVNLRYGGTLGEGLYLPSGGYSLLLPLLDNHIRLEDRYFENHRPTSVEAARESSLLIQTPETGSFKAEGKLDWNGETLHRDWKVSAGTDPGKKLSLTLTEGFMSEETRENIPVEGDFYQRYGGFSRLLLPMETGGERYRSGAHRLDLNYRSDCFSLSFAPGMSSRTYPQEEPFSLAISGDWTLNLAARPAAGRSRSGSLSLSYSRSASERDVYRGETGFVQDLEELVHRMPDYPLLWTNPPFFEIWSDESREDFIRTSEGRISASSSSAASFAYHKQPGSHLRDLLLPGSLEGSAARTLVRDFDSISDTLDLTGSYRATALNLFGRLGRYPVFQWYRTEEIGYSLGYAGTIPLGEEDGEGESHRIHAEQVLEFTFSERSSAGIENSVEIGLLEEEENFNSLLYWERQRPVDWDFPLRERLEAERQYLHHREDINLDRYKNKNIGGEENSFSLILSHASELRVPETGFFKVFGRIGYERIDSGTSGRILQTNTLALELGMELELLF